MKQIKLSSNERIHLITALLVTSLVTLDKSQLGTMKRLSKKVLVSLA